jgi:clan AA aspartic protease (TIGR02281 family)
MHRPNSTLGSCLPPAKACRKTMGRRSGGIARRLAQFSLGVMFETGQGVPPSSVQAVTWYRKAADQGHIDAQRRLGFLCPKGTGNQACTTLEGKTPLERKSLSGIPLHRRGDAFLISALINDVLTLDFVIDSGASDVSVPADVVQTLMRNGTLRKEDFLGSRIYKLADGSMVPSERFTIRTIKVGEREIENVTANVAKASGPLLLGQSFLTHFKSWSIDNDRGVLLLN